MSARAIFISDWSIHQPSIRLDLLGLIFAVALHAPLFLLKWEPRKKAVDRPAQRLVAVDLMDEQQLKKQQEEAAKPAAAPEPKNNLMAKLKALVVKAPPPPEPKKVVQQKIDLGPKQIDMKANVPNPEALKPKLESKRGFETTADPKLVQEKKVALAGGGPISAPLSANKVGVVEDRQSLKSSKSGFQISKGESLSGIGGGPKIADPTAPAISIRTGSSGTKEALSAAPSKADKGKFGGAAATGLGGQSMGLRDQIIARDAAPAQIAMSGSSSGGMPGGVIGGSKRDAGRFSGGDVGVAGGTGSGRGGVVGGTGTAIKGPAVSAAAAPAKRKQSMFMIQGPLKDRKIERQVSPDYPPALQSKGIEGSVVLEFKVNPNGTVRNVIVVRRTSGYPAMDESAIRALQQWRFAPLADEDREEVGLITFNYSLS